MTELALTVYPLDSDPVERNARVERIVNCGYTGRDREAVERHVDELEAEGVAPPPEVPMLYPKPRGLVTTDSSIEVAGERTSGEAEFFLLSNGEDTYVGVGSDHTDRKLEQDDIPLSKIVCPNVVGTSAWRLADLEDHWDRIELRSWTVIDGEQIRYQDATLERILPPSTLRRFVNERIDAPVENTAIFSGSVGTETEELLYGDAFEIELADPVLERTLECRYEVDVIDWA